MALSGSDRTIERAARAAGERDNVTGLAFQPFELEARRFVRRGIHESARGQSHQAAITGIARSQQHNARALRARIGVTRAAVGVAEIDGERTANNRLNAAACELFGEF